MAPLYRTATAIGETRADALGSAWISLGVDPDDNRATWDWSANTCKVTLTYFPVPESGPDYVGLSLGRMGSNRLTGGLERHGQALFNVIRETDPEFAEVISGTTADPFHAMLGDDRYLAALDAISNHDAARAKRALGDVNRMIDDATAGGTHAANAVEVSALTARRAELTPAVTPEPPPEPNAGTPIWELVIVDVAASFSRTDGVISDMRARDAFGRAKYGVPVLAGNGRDPLVDAYQEALDLCVYLRQAIEEGRREVGSQYNAALRLAIDLHRAVAR